jgi:hypothetical protein
MTVTDVAPSETTLTTAEFVSPHNAPPPRDLQRTFQLTLATVWLFDAILQIQPFMFTRGASGFSGMLNGVAAGNPSWIGQSITWNSSIVYRQPILTDAVFAGIQFLIAFGIIYKRTLRPALTLSIAWSILVWWFGEGLGGIASGRATPFGGGPGGVLFYAVLAVLLWPSEGQDRPFVAARTVGVRPAKAIWAFMWVLLAVLCVVGSGRSPQALRDLVAGLNSGQPGWLAHVDRSTESLFIHDGTTMAVLLALFCLVVAVGVFMPPRITQLTLALAIGVFGLIWIAVQDFGGILAGGATDPNAAPMVIFIALTYWPLTNRRGSPVYDKDGKSRPLVNAQGD